MEVSLVVLTSQGTVRLEERRIKAEAKENEDEERSRLFAT